MVGALVFVDDSRQRSPSRRGMGPLVSVGGLLVPWESAGQFERALADLCSSFNFPPGEPFKWSPGRGLWMYSNLTGDRRVEFFVKALDSAREHGGCGFTVIEDVAHAQAIPSAPSRESDVTQMSLERATNLLAARACHGLVISDRPSGGRSDEDKFLAGCLEAIQSEANYIKPERLVVNVLSTPAKFMRLLQVADLITSCTTAFVAGEDQHSPRVFPSIKSLLSTDSGRIGGTGVKIHPDFRYRNLYHWLLGDTHFVRTNQGWPLPSDQFCYFRGANVP